MSGFRVMIQRNLRLIAIVPCLFALGSGPAPDKEPILTSKVVISNLPGEPCTESVEVCVPVWRDFFETRGTGLVALHIDHSEEAPDLRFVVVSGVAPGGPGDRAGIRVGDEVLEINGIDLEKDPGSVLPRALLSIRIGEEVTYVVRRQGQRLTKRFESQEILEKGIDQWVFKCVTETFGVSAARSFLEELQRNRDE